MRTLLVDDEPLALRGLRLRLEAFPDIEIVAECSTPREALTALRDHPIDLLFLDIELPEQNGFDLLRNLPQKHSPLVIFLTAYSDHALSAFEVDAVDYLLKPLDPERLEASLSRARSRLAQRKQQAYLQISENGEIVRIPTQAVDRVEAAGDYMCIHTGSETHIVRITMAELEKQLLGHGFQRIHRSRLVNLNCITRLQSCGSDCEIVLRDETRLRVSRKYREALRRAIQDIPSG